MEDNTKIIILTIILILTISLNITQYLIRQSNMKNECAETLKELNGLALKSCGEKKMIYNSIITDDFKTFQYNCITKSPYREFSQMVTP